jgi:hypothetical protein
MSSAAATLAITLPLGLLLLVLGWRWTRLDRPPAMTISNAEHTRTITEPEAKLRAARRIGWGGVAMGLLLLLVAGLSAAQELGLIVPDGARA